MAHSRSANQQPCGDDRLLAEARNQLPVKKLGPNIAMTCQDMPSVASSGEKPQPTIASGAPVMTNTHQRVGADAAEQADDEARLPHDLLRAAAPSMVDLLRHQCAERGRKDRIAAPMATRATGSRQRACKHHRREQFARKDDDLRAEDGGDDSAGQHERNGARLEFRRSVVGGGETELLNEGPANADDRQPRAKIQKFCRKDRHRRNAGRQAR
jgi:hypothetical protein